MFNALVNNLSAHEVYNTPTRAQTAELRPVQLAQPFLTSIPMIPVSEIAGQKVLVGLSARVASRTDTSSSGERVPKTLLSLGSQNYDAVATEFDVGIRYADIDAWAKFPNFTDLYMQAVRNAIAQDMLQTGWTGTSAATSTNIGTNPLLQDLNIGWLQKIRTFNSASQYVIGTGPSPISIGKTTGVFKNLDHLVRDATERVSLAHRDRTDLVALISRNLVASQENTYFADNGNTPSEKILLDGVVRKAYGGLPTIVPPFMPNGAVLITPLSNLAIYYQDSSVRRLQRDWPSKNQVQEFNSMNLAYVVQDEFATSLVENVTLVS
jgi:P2 family phage major capsid protein